MKRYSKKREKSKQYGGKHTSSIIRLNDTYIIKAHNLHIPMYQWGLKTMFKGLMAFGILILGIIFRIT